MHTPTRSPAYPECLHLLPSWSQDSATAGEYDVDVEANVEEEREPEVKPKILLMGPKR